MSVAHKKACVGLLSPTQEGPDRDAAAAAEPDGAIEDGSDLGSLSADEEAPGDHDGAPADDGAPAGDDAPTGDDAPAGDDAFDLATTIMPRSLQDETRLLSRLFMS